MNNRTEIQDSSPGVQLEEFHGNLQSTFLGECLLKMTESRAKLKRTFKLAKNGLDQGATHVGIAGYTLTNYQLIRSVWKNKL